MPINIGSQHVYIDDPDNTDLSKLYATGELGMKFITQVPLRTSPTGPVAVAGASRSFQIVQLDSGVTVPATRGAVAWWKDKAKYIVTLSQLSAVNRNSVAGIVPGSVTAGNYTCIQIQGPQYVQVTAPALAAVASGDSLIPSLNDNGKADRVASGTAVTFTKIGIADGPALANGLILTDLVLSGVGTT
jgi:hypothetical protein